MGQGPASHARGIYPLLIYPQLRTFPLADSESRAHIGGKGKPTGGGSDT